MSISSPLSQPKRIASSFAPGLLIAGPDLGDPNFDRSVVLMAEHGDEGAVGFVVNQISDVNIQEVADGLEVALGADERQCVLGEQVMNGGPVHPDMLWVLFKRPPSDDEEEGVLDVTPELGLGHAREILEAFVQGQRPEPFVLLLGYAGWGQSQLEAETAAGAWIPVDLDLDLIFEVPLATRWEVALQRAGLKPGGFVMGKHGGFA